MTQGTCNGGDRGNTKDRRRRKEWLVETYRADQDADPTASDLEQLLGWGVPRGEGEPACRCYRCGVLLTVETVSPDRIKPGCLGGTYRRENLRPACSHCQSVTGNEIKAVINTTKKEKANGRR